MLKRKGQHIITMKTEHKSVLDTCQHLEKEGFKVTYLLPEKNGLLSLEDLQAAIRPDTIIVSIMHVNNETGVIQDLARIASLTAANDIILHVDAVQSIGKTAINVQDVPINLLSLSAHKAHGPKGIGALYLRKKPRIRVEPLIHGGGHEYGMRSGTLATHQIVGMGEAYALAAAQLAKDEQYVKTLREHFLAELKTLDVTVNVNLADAVPHILNIRFKRMHAKALLEQIPQLAASTGSACQGAGADGSYVLQAMGMTSDEIQRSLRISFSRFTTTQDVLEAAKAIVSSRA